MTTYLEDELRDMFAEEGARAPQRLDPSTMAARARQARSTQQRPRAYRLGLAAGGVVLAAAAVAVAPILTGSVGEQQPPDSAELAPPTATSPPSVSPDGPGAPSGALPAPALLRCTYAYSPQTLAQTSSFAFDGTVTTIGPPRGGDSEDGAYVAVSFTVHEWFAGGNADTITVDMIPPDIEAFESTPPAYQAGTRLLVSGQPRAAGDPAGSLVAEACSGFTRYYDDPTAAAWRDAYR